jgi:hypothetical protein
MTRDKALRFLMGLGLCLPLAGLPLAQDAPAAKLLPNLRCAVGWVLPIAGKAATAGQDTQGFSAAFLTASIRQLEDAMLWKDGITKVVRYNAPAGQWLENYRTRAAESLKLASLQATTAADGDGLRLLTNQFNNLQQWNTNAVAAQQTMAGAETTMSTSGLKDDPLFMKISDCSKYLGAMFTSGVFADNPACH